MREPRGRCQRRCPRRTSIEVFPDPGGPTRTRGFAGRRTVRRGRGVSARVDSAATRPQRTCCRVAVVIQSPAQCERHKGVYYGVPFCRSMGGFGSGCGRKPRKLAVINEKVRGVARRCGGERLVRPWLPPKRLFERGVRDGAEIGRGRAVKGQRIGTRHFELPARLSPHQSPLQRVQRSYNVERGDASALEQGSRGSPTNGARRGDEAFSAD